jgi:biopolymer transport protein TolR
VNVAHQSSSAADETITGINVTPLVDVVLVLLVVLMVTATYLASKAIPVDLPAAATGEASAAPLSVSVDKSGKLFLDGTALDEAELARRVRSRRAEDPELRAVIAADGAVSHRLVVRVIDLLRRENVIRFAINVNPDDLGAKAQ